MFSLSRVCGCWLGIIVVDWPFSLFPFFLFFFSCSFDISQPLLSSSIYNPPQTLTHKSSSTIAYTTIFFRGGFVLFLYRLRRPPPHHGGGDKIRFHARQPEVRPGATTHVSGWLWPQLSSLSIILYRVLCVFVLSFFFFFTSPLFCGGGGRQFLQMI